MPRLDPRVPIELIRKTFKGINTRDIPYQVKRFFTSKSELKRLYTKGLLYNRLDEDEVDRLLARKLDQSEDIDTDGNIDIIVETLGFILEGILSDTPLSTLPSFDSRDLTHMRPFKMAYSNLANNILLAIFKNAYTLNMGKNGNIGRIEGKHLKYFNDNIYYQSEKNLVLDKIMANKDVSNMDILDNLYLHLYLITTATYNDMKSKIDKINSNNTEQDLPIEEYANELTSAYLSYTSDKMKENEDRLISQEIAEIISNNSDHIVDNILDEIKTPDSPMSIFSESIFKVARYYPHEDKSNLLRFIFEVANEAIDRLSDEELSKIANKDVEEVSEDTTGEEISSHLLPTMMQLGNVYIDIKLYANLFDNTELIEKYDNVITDYDGIEFESIRNNIEDFKLIFNDIKEKLSNIEYALVTNSEARKICGIIGYVYQKSENDFVSITPVESFEIRDEEWYLIPKMYLSDNVLSKHSIQSDEHIGSKDVMMMAIANSHESAISEYADGTLKLKPTLIDNVLGNIVNLSFGELIAKVKEILEKYEDHGPLSKYRLVTEKEISDVTRESIHKLSAESRRLILPADSLYYIYGSSLTEMMCKTSLSKENTTKDNGEILNDVTIDGSLSRFSYSVIRGMKLASGMYEVNSPEFFAHFNAAIRVVLRTNTNVLGNYDTKTPWSDEEVEYLENNFYINNFHVDDIEVYESDGEEFADMIMGITNDHIDEMLKITSVNNIKATLTRLVDSDQLYRFDWIDSYPMELPEDTEVEIIEMGESIVSKIDEAGLKEDLVKLLSDIGKLDKDKLLSLLSRIEDLKKKIDTTSTNTDIRKKELAVIRKMLDSTNEKVKDGNIR